MSNDIANISRRDEVESKPRFRCSSCEKDPSQLHKTTVFQTVLVPRHQSDIITCALTFWWMKRQHPIIGLHSTGPQTHNTPRDTFTTSVTCL